MSRSIAFHGAAQTVTGSRHLIQFDGRSVLVDCGLFQGGQELEERNRSGPGFDVAALDALVLTHAHMDHIGFLPVLHKMGYQGPVYATPPTIALAKISLPDSGRIQEEDAKYAAKKGRDTRGPLYTEADAYACMRLFRPVRYFEQAELGKGAGFRFLPAGHILGSAFAEVWFSDGERLLMGGDLGRPNRPILKDPTVVESTDWLVLESTYGDRLHDRDDAAESLRAVLEEAARSRGCVIVPSFAIGRTQELLWWIHRLGDEGRIPRIPIYVDSPMASSVTQVYAKAVEDHDAEMQGETAAGHKPLSDEGVRIVRDRAMSKALNDMRGPLVIISGSGMATGGRVVHHLKRRLSDPSTTVLFTGYQAEGTTGRRLLDGAGSLTLHGEEVEVRARVRSLGGLSAHADQAETMAWLRGFVRPPKRTYLVHGEPPAQAVLADKIRSELGWEVTVPAHGQRYGF
jgi:metallo-beta-lactamase family protein